MTEVRLMRYETPVVPILPGQIKQEPMGVEQILIFDVPEQHQHDAYSVLSDRLRIDEKAIPMHPVKMEPTQERCFLAFPGVGYKFRREELQTIYTAVRDLNWFINNEELGTESLRIRLEQELQTVES